MNDPVSDIETVMGPEVKITFKGNALKMAMILTPREVFKIGTRWKLDRLGGYNEQIVQVCGVWPPRPFADDLPDRLYLKCFHIIGHEPPLRYVLSTVLHENLKPLDD